MIYEWDRGKAATNVKKHRVRFEAAASVFLDPLAIRNPYPRCRADCVDVGPCTDDSCVGGSEEAVAAASVQLGDVE